MPTLAPPVSAAAHLDWAAQIARTVARKGRLHGQELLDLISTAHVALLELIASDTFDQSQVPAGGSLSGAFRGWAYLTIRCACVREAMRMRGGGTFHTHRPGRVIVADPLGDTAAAIESEPLTAQPDAVLGIILEEKPHSHYGRTFRRGCV